MGVEGVVLCQHAVTQLGAGRNGDLIFTKRDMRCAGNKGGSTRIQPHFLCFPIDQQCYLLIGGQGVSFISIQLKKVLIVISAGDRSNIYLRRQDRQGITLQRKPQRVGSNGAADHRSRWDLKGSQPHSRCCSCAAGHKIIVKHQYLTAEVSTVIAVF